MSTPLPQVTTVRGDFLRKVLSPQVGVVDGKILQAFMNEITNPKWETDYATALAKATSYGSNVLAAFTSPAVCPYCANLEAKVFATPQFSLWRLNRGFVLLKLDKQANPSQAIHDLYGKYEVTGIPTVVAIQPPEGTLPEKEIGRVLGFSASWTVADWIAKFEQATATAGSPPPPAEMHDVSPVRWH